MKVLSQTTVIAIAAISLNLTASLATAEVSCHEVFHQNEASQANPTPLFLANPAGSNIGATKGKKKDPFKEEFKGYLREQGISNTEATAPRSGDPYADFLTHPLPTARALSIVGKVSKEDVRLFNSNASSFKALAAFEKDLKFFEEKLYIYLITKAFKTHDPLKQENIDLSHDRLHELETLEAQLKPIKQSILESRSKKKAYAAKIELIKALKVYSAFLTDLTGKEINLLRQDHFLEFFGLSKRNEIAHFLQTLDREFSDIINRQRRSNNVEPVETRHLFYRLIEYFFGEGNRQIFNKNDLGVVSRIADSAEAIRLIKALRLPEKDEALFLSEIAEIADQVAGNNSTKMAVQHLMNALVVIKASEAVFGKSDSVYIPFLKNNQFEPKSYLSIRSMIEHSEHVRVVTEAKIANYLDKTDSHNARIADMDASLTRISERSTSDIEKRVTALRTELRELEIKDFDRNLDRRSQALLLLEIKLDQLREDVAKRTRRESISDFFELNNRWQRLIPEKAYLLDGTDYKAVTFSDDVIAFFDNNPLLGARYLATLGKNRYVAVKKQSGLRRLPSIHPDFRDIKVIRSHGKIRIIGRLVDDTLHFFHVYNSDKPYDNKSIERIVEQFSPGATQ